MCFHNLKTSIMKELFLFNCLRVFRNELPIMIRHKLYVGVSYGPAATARFWTQSKKFSFTVFTIHVPCSVFQSAPALNSVSNGGCYSRSFPITITYHSRYHFQSIPIILLLKWIKLLFHYSSGKFLQENRQLYCLQAIFHVKLCVLLYVPLRCTFSSTVRTVAHKVNFSSRSQRSLKSLPKTIFPSVLAFGSMASMVTCTLTTLTPFWLSFWAYHSTFLQRRLLHSISACTTMLAFRNAYRCSTLRTSLFTHLRGLPDHCFPMSSPRFVLKPFIKLLISTLPAYVKLYYLHRSWPPRTLHICVPSCLFVST